MWAAECVGVSEAKRHVSSARVWLHCWQHCHVLRDGSWHKFMHNSQFLWLTMILFSLTLLFLSSLLPCALQIHGPSATRARPHQPVHLQPASFYGWAGAGEHAETPGPRHLHKDIEGCQRGQQRSWFCQVRSNNDTNVTWIHQFKGGIFSQYVAQLPLGMQ